jgi:hypothetical protein
MKQLLIAPVFLASALGGMHAPIVNPHAPRLSSGERVALTSRADSSLERLRAGASGDVARLSPIEQAQLKVAQRSAPQLESMRAGYMSDHDLVIVAVAVLAVLLLIAIA